MGLHQRLLATITQSPKFLIIGLLKLYKWTLSPLLGQRCRFYPSCSDYAQEAFKTHSIVKALGLTTKRLLKCQPFCKGGYDPVPPVKKKEPK